jgi:hypothetical protein
MSAGAAAQPRHACLKSCWPTGSTVSALVRPHYAARHPPVFPTRTGHALRRPQRVRSCSAALQWASAAALQWWSHQPPPPPRSHTDTLHGANFLASFIQNHNQINQAPWYIITPFV